MAQFVPKVLENAGIQVATSGQLIRLLHQARDQGIISAKQCSQLKNQLKILDFHVVPLPLIRLDCSLVCIDHIGGGQSPHTDTCIAKGRMGERPLNTIFLNSSFTYPHVFGVFNCELSTRFGDFSMNPNRLDLILPESDLLVYPNPWASFGEDLDEVYKRVLVKCDEQGIGSSPSRPSSVRAIIFLASYMCRYYSHNLEKAGAVDPAVMVQWFGLLGSNTAKKICEAGIEVAQVYMFERMKLGSLLVFDDASTSSTCFRWILEIISGERRSPIIKSS